MVGVSGRIIEPVGAGDGKRLGAIGIQRRGDVRVPLKAERHIAGDHVGNELADILVGHMRHLHAGELAEELAGKMLRAADADRSVIQPGFFLP